MYHYCTCMQLCTFYADKPTITGNMCVICPVSSNTMTDVDMVCVTPPAIAAAPTTAYPPGLMRRPLMPLMKAKSIISPTTRPNAAPEEKSAHVQVKVNIIENTIHVMLICLSIFSCHYCLRYNGKANSIWIRQLNAVSF